MEVSVEWYDEGIAEGGWSCIFWGMGVNLEYTE